MNKTRVKHFIERHSFANWHEDCTACLADKLARLERIVKASLDAKQPVILKEVEDLK